MTTYYSNEGEDIDIKMDESRFDAIVDAYKEGLYKYVNSLFERSDLTEYQKLCIIHESSLLPYGNWIDECPLNLYTRMIDDVEYKYDKVSFVPLLNNYKSSFENLEDAIHEVYEWVKENKLIGTHLNW